MTTQNRLEPIVGAADPVRRYALGQGSTGHIAQLFKRVDVHKLEQVGTVLLTGDGIRSERIAEAPCRALDDELASRP